MVARTMPPLIEALRGWWKRDVYFEALKIFYERAVLPFEKQGIKSRDQNWFRKISARTGKPRSRRSPVLPSLEELHISPNPRDYADHPNLFAADIFLHFLAGTRLKRLQVDMYFPTVKCRAHIDTTINLQKQTIERQL
ncbi:hypothetical protein M7I_4326 [Glarea lozoyensis 74030]|uniref:Uncharacterized protein n=1 Tax=Glarea lozoyensis (strain ATCC 74030 / MF5533) TaxID=1104152 RepID=H0ENW3_GLAL7|nr:hypothetical protein M7I_4326 [Glarea lozoyensis 74030]